MKKLEITTLDDLDTVLSVCRSMFEAQGKLTVSVSSTVEEPKQDRTIAQNSLLWLWNTETGKKRNQTPDEMHEFFKEKFLCNMFIRDDPGYAAMALSIKRVRAHSVEDYLALKKKVIEMTSTTDCNVKQMREYLNYIKEWAIVEGIQITEPELKGLI